MTTAAIHYRQCYGCGVEVDGALLCPDCARECGSAGVVPSDDMAWDLDGGQRRKWALWFWFAWGVLVLAIAGHFIFGD